MKCWGLQHELLNPLRASVSWSVIGGWDQVTTQPSFLAPALVPRVLEVWGRSPGVLG